MSEEIVYAAACQIQQHRMSAAHTGVRIILHGGEPLLFGKARFIHLAETFAKVLVDDYTICMQTNGLLLDEEWVSLLDKLDIQVGLSLDGPQSDHDRNRVDHRGDGSHKRVEGALRLLQSSAAGMRIFGGTISVISLECPPERLYSYLRGLGVKQLNLLLPEANIERPPAPGAAGMCDYSAYLTCFFDLWMAENDPDVRIGFFETAIRLLLGHPLADDFWGVQPVRIAVVETDGSLEPVDALKTCADGFTKLGLNVLHDPVERLVQTGLMQAQLEPEQHLCQTCQQCEWKDVCGGGALAHRFHPQNQFDNPSVYCLEIQDFLSHARAKLAAHAAY